jgi:hypothetical protein
MSVLAGPILTTAIVAGAAASSEADWLRVPASACQPVGDYEVYSATSGFPEQQGTASYSITEWSNLAELVPTLSGLKSASGRSAVVCPIPDTSQMPATRFTHINIHFTDQASNQKARAYFVKKFWGREGFDAVFLGTNGSPSNVCTSGPMCTISANLNIQADGNFYSVVVILPGGYSELNGLFLSN